MSNNQSGIQNLLFAIRHSFGVFAVIAAGTAANASAPPLVTITGGGDETGHMYNWKVTNDHDSPIVYIEFPQYRGGLRIAPEGWTSEVTNPRGVGGLAGEFIATADRPADGIARGRSAEFKLRIVAEGASRGEGLVLVRFADGSEVRIPAEVPAKAPPTDRNISLIGLSLIFGIFLLVRVLRRKRPPPSAAQPIVGESAAPADSGP